MVQKIHMRWKSSIIAIGFLLILAISINISASDAGIVEKTRNIKILNSENDLLVEENIVLNNSGNENVTELRFWFQQNSDDIKIIETDSGEYLTPIVNGNFRECNLTDSGIQINPDNSVNIKITYSLPKIEFFEKTLVYDSNSITLTYEDDEIYKIQNIDAESSFSARLYRPTDTPLGIEYIIVIIVLVVMLIVLGLFLIKKQRNKDKIKTVDTKETLETKKTLLLSLLKDIEKQHRAKKLSDETYTKLKGEYKQQAVEAMRKLEDIK